MEFRLIRSNRKTISLQITPAGELIVRCPAQMKKADVDAFVQSKRSWIEKHLPTRDAMAAPQFTPEELEAMAQEALQVLPQRVKHYAKIMGVTYGKITIRNQRTRWGSCSGKGNLNFNCLLMRTPPQVQDYVVVHELCHRKEMNHSSAFWSQVETILPDYRESRSWLKEHGGELIGRLG